MPRSRRELRRRAGRDLGPPSRRAATGAPHGGKPLAAQWNAARHESLAATRPGYVFALPDGDRFTWPVQDQRAMEWLRGAGLIELAGPPKVTAAGERWTARRTDAGERLLAEWNSEHGEPGGG